MEVVVNPPRPGEPSYDQFLAEKSEVLRQLDHKAKMVSKQLNAIKGVSCNEVMGAMYAFPQLHLSSKAVAAAKVREGQLLEGQIL